MMDSWRRMGHGLCCAGIIAVCCSPALFAERSDRAGQRAAGDALVAQFEEALGRSDEFMGLDEEIRAALLERLVRFISVRQNETREDYSRMMEEWGCVLTIREGSPEYRSLAEGWHPAGTDLGIRTVDFKRISVRVLAGDEAANSQWASWPTLQPKSMRSIHVCMFGAPTRQAELARIDRTVLELVYPAITEDGTRLTVGYRWVWDSKTGSWFPWVMYQEVEFGKPGPVQFF